jgi:hypothetical protein
MFSDLANLSTFLSVFATGFVLIVGFILKNLSENKFNQEKKQFRLEVENLIQVQLKDYITRLEFEREFHKLDLNLRDINHHLKLISAKLRIKDDDEED